MEIVDKQTRINEAEKFFNLIFGNVTERKFGYLWTKQDKSSYPFTVSNVDERKAMATRAIELSDKGFDVYFGVNLMDEPAAKDKRVKAEHVTLQTATVTDIDVEGGDHISTDKKLYPPTFDVAKSFLPFDVSLLVNSGFGGLHGYCIYATPVTVTNETRADCEARNKKFIEAIRRKAGKYSKVVDGVGDLPRVLRVPGTYNYKCGKEDAPLCKLVEANDTRFTPDDLTARLKALETAGETKQEEPPPMKAKVLSINTTDRLTEKPTEQERAIAMLDVIPCADQTRDDWIQVGMILKNNGNTVSDWVSWSRNDSRFKVGECEKLWQGFRDNGGLTIATLHKLAASYGYSEKDLWRDLHKVIALDAGRTAKVQFGLETNQNDELSFGVSDSISPKTTRQERTGSMEDLITTREVADILDVSKKTVENWRNRKLFGCYFFPADEKRGDTWYYRRERVLQLKSVYQFGILQNMYKLARKNPEPTPPADFQKPSSSRRQDDSESGFQKPSSSRKLDEEELSFRHKEFFTLDEVADYFGVDKKTVQKWHERGQLKDDMLGHNGDLYFAIDNVLEFTPPAERKTDKSPRIIHRPPDEDELKARLAELQKQPRSESRDKKIIATIRELCTWNHDKNNNRTTIKPTVHNIELIFDNDPYLSGLFGFDKFQEENIFLKKAPWNEDDNAGEKWRDSDDANLRTYLRKNYAELKERQLIEDYVVVHAGQHSFHPVKKFFDTLPQWDKTPRAETLFVKFLGAVDNEYTREVTLKWLLGFVARVYHPGCDFQWCPVINGAQRIGKSRLIKMLGGKEGVNPNGYQWHVALKDSVDDAHSVDALQKGGIIEIEEFSAARRAEINALKSFISAEEDTRRFAYDRHATTRKRHCVFIVTCNDQQFLRDPTGNTRFWIIECTKEKFKRVDGMTPEYIRQVWAEVYYRYQELFKDGFDEAKLRPSEALERRAEEIADAYVQDDGMTLEIKSFLNKRIPPKIIWKLMTKEDRRKFFTDGQITFDIATLNYRRRAQGGREQDVQHDINEIYKLCNSKREDIQQIFFGTETSYRFYGAEYRQHICAAEIFNEAFANGDKRKLMYRINEILTDLEGWHLGDRLQKADPEYREQKKPYWRDEDNRPDDNKKTDVAIRDTSVVTGQGENDSFKPTEEELKDEPVEMASEAVPFDDDDLPL